MGACHGTQRARRNAIALRQAADTDVTLGAEPRRNHVRDDRGPGADLSSFLRAVVGPHEPASVDDSKQEQQEQRQDERKLCRSPTLVTKKSAHDHSPMTAACSVAL